MRQIVLGEDPLHYSVPDFDKLTEIYYTSQFMEDGQTPTADQMQAFDTLAEIDKRFNQ